MRALPSEPKTTSAPRLLEHHLRRLTGDPDLCIETYHNRSGERKTYIWQGGMVSRRNIYLELWMCALLVHELRAEQGPLPPSELRALLIAREMSWSTDLRDKMREVDALIEDRLKERNVACVSIEGSTGERRPCLILFSPKVHVGNPATDISSRFLLQRTRPLTWEEFERFAKALLAVESLDVPRLAGLWNEHGKEMMWG